ncbi:MAG: 6-bladed beta-propeller [Candidatus Aminicenantales bacterium]
MAKKPLSFSILFFAAFHLGVVLSLPNDAGAAMALPQNEGPIIVRNGKTPVLQNGKPVMVTLKNDLILGQDQDDPNTSFSRVNYFAIDEQGKIFVMDQKEFRVKIFAPSGTFIKSFGRRGQGPGEFQSPGVIRFAPDGNLIIQELVNRRLQYFTAEGKWLKAISYPTLYLGDFQGDSRGFFYATIVTLDAPPMKFELMKFDAGLHPIKSITSIEWPQKSRIVPFSLPSLYFDVNRHDELIWANSMKYGIHVIDANGKPVREIYRESPPLEVTPNAKNRFLHEVEELDKKSPIEFPKSTYEFPKYFPAMQALFVDDQNRIYARIFETNKTGDILYDVFDENGIFIARFSLPENEEATVIKKNRLYAIIRDQIKGEYILKRYLMTWK